LAANLCTVRLYKGAALKRERDLNLDPRSNRILRETLERMVIEHEGNLRRDLSQYSLHVHVANLGKRLLARCNVDRDGRTMVRR
jgi:hypothetical protein